MMEANESWYKALEMTKKKARSLLKSIIAVDQTSSIVIGKLESADLDRLNAGHQQSCKLVLSNAKRYGTENKFKFSGEDDMFLFVNNPEKILSMDDLSERYPEIFKEVHINIRKGVWDGPAKH